MNACAMLVAVIVLSIVACGGRSEPQDDNARDSKSRTDSSQLQENNRLPPEIRIEPAASLTSETLDARRRRYRIEYMSPTHQLLLAIPRDNVAPTKTRVDGLLERSLSLDVETVFVGKDPGSVAQAHEIVAPEQVVQGERLEPYKLPRQEFIVRDGKARLVLLQSCLEKDGQKRRVVHSAKVQSPEFLAKLTEDASKYKPKAAVELLPCERATSPLQSRWLESMHL